MEALQRHLVDSLGHADFVKVEWLRDEGRHGGGSRFACAETDLFDRASVNVSCVHYDDDPAKRLASATALSTIIHPRHPRAASLHLHTSFTQLRNGRSSWRLMADLNPSHEDPVEKEHFEASLKAAAPEQFATGRAQGDRYFFIPALGRHRGLTHFYLEDFSLGDFGAERAFVERFAKTMIATWCELFDTALARSPAFTPGEREKQLAYHTLYLFQVLTLDRGTTSGLLVHDQNDLGVMGSLPSWVDRALLASWEPLVPKPQDALVRATLSTLPAGQPSHVTDEVRVELARVVRAHYLAHPHAVELQAARAR